jgi:hypothetical protein
VPQVIPIPTVPVPADPDRRAPHPSPSARPAASSGIQEVPETPPELLRRPTAREPPGLAATRFGGRLVRASQRLQCFSSGFLPASITSTFKMLGTRGGKGAAWLCVASSAPFSFAFNASGLQCRPATPSSLVAAGALHPLPLQREVVPQCK